MTEQGSNRATIDRALAPYGWKVDRARLERGTIIAYTIRREKDGLVATFRLPLHDLLQREEIVMDLGDGEISGTTLWLMVMLVALAKQRNAESPTP